MVKSGQPPVWPRSVLEQEPLEHLLDYRRLRTVAFPILRAASEFCDSTRPFFGLSATSGDNSPNSRSGAESTGQGSELRVLHTIAGSPAHRTGLREGDVVLSVEGVSLPPGSEGAKLLFDALARHDDSPLQLLVRRRLVRQIVQVTPVDVCDVEVDLAFGTDVSAWARGNKVTVSDAMLRFAADDAELALVISHELSHVILGHTTSFFGRGSVSSEREADRMGSYLMAKAGYDPDRGSRILIRMADAFPWGDDDSEPSLRRRYEAVRHIAGGMGR